VVWNGFGGDEMKCSLLYDSRNYGDEILISYIIPLFNTERYVLEAIESISCASGKDIEIIVVDDGSTDNSANIVLDWMRNALLPCVLIKQPNSGPSAARMLGISYARGEYIGFCDSDDFIDVAAFKKAISIAKSYECDVIFLRSVVFDSVTGESYDFYDTYWWDHILKDRGFAVVTATSAPAVFRLEPNANTRLLKRSFIEKERLSFPVGLDFFEDFTFHVAELAAAKIFMYDKTGYYYRVNRSGKLTEQKSAKRFDMLKSVDLAFKEASSRNVDLLGWSYIICIASRVMYWCGQNTLVKDRKRFFELATELIQKNVSKELYDTCMDTFIDKQERVLLSALKVGAVNFLVTHASEGRIRAIDTLPLMLSKDYGKASRDVVVKIFLFKVKSIFLYKKQ
jgi:glycosyltransferase involved in cell wall biosynthesis